MFHLFRFILVMYCFLSVAILTAWTLSKNNSSDDAVTLSTAQPAGARPVSDSNVAQEFLHASQHCLQHESLSNELRAQVNAFHYADLPVVHRYLHCIWSRMDLWNDRNGFQVDRIADLYHTRANGDLLVPTLINCNRNDQLVAPLRWCYRATQCILDSHIGQWFRADVARVKVLSNGH